MADQHDEEELRALGMLEASLGVRQRGAMDEQVTKEAAQENLRDWLTVGRDIDQDANGDPRGRRRNGYEIPRALWVVLMVLLVCAAALCLAVVLTA